MHSRGNVVRINVVQLPTRLLRWTESIAQKMKRRKKVEDHSRREIWQSVFDPSPSMGESASYMVRLGTLSSFASSTSCILQVKTLDHKLPMTQVAYDKYVPIHPPVFRLIFISVALRSQYAMQFPQESTRR